MCVCGGGGVVPPFPNLDLPCYSLHCTEKPAYLHSLARASTAQNGLRYVQVLRTRFELSISLVFLSISLNMFWMLKVMLH